MQIDQNVVQQMESHTARKKENRKIELSRDTKHVEEMPQNAKQTKTIII